MEASYPNMMSFNVIEFQEFSYIIQLQNMDLDLIKNIEQTPDLNSNNDFLQMRQKILENFMALSRKIFTL